MNPYNFPGRKELRQAQAVARQDLRNKLSPVQQLEKLNEYGLTAKKERARLNELIAKDVRNGKT